MCTRTRSVRGEDHLEHLCLVPLSFLHVGPSLAASGAATPTSTAFLSASSFLCPSDPEMSLYCWAPQKRKWGFSHTSDPEPAQGTSLGCHCLSPLRLSGTPPARMWQEKEVLSLANREVTFEGIFWRSCQFLLVAWHSLREMLPRDPGAGAWIRLVWLSPASEKRERQVYSRHRQVCSVHKYTKLFHTPGESCLICCLNKPVTTWHQFTNVFETWRCFFNWWSP